MSIITELKREVKYATGLKVPINIQGIGFQVPETVVTNKEIIKGLDTTEEWIQTKTGIQERRFLEEPYVTSDLCVGACNEALIDAGITAEEVDIIILTTVTPDQSLPSTAMILKDKLGAVNAIPYDLNQAACAGGIYSIYLAAHLLQSENINNVLVVGAEVLSRVTDPTDRSTRVFFGDAAGAMVLQKTKDGYGLLSFDLQDEVNDAVQIPGGGTDALRSSGIDATDLFIKMNGREVWNVATRAIPSSIQHTVQSAGLTIKDIDHFIIHQANLNIIREALDTLQVPYDKTTVTVQEYGNTGSATIFSSIYKAVKEGNVSDNDYIVFSAIGAGFLWGSLCFRYIHN
ncbi:3-oxoacyl-ACP synthase III family protein [Robertmurraya massiliosenegalensis]|uniref:3-oxoacyl-ACP synthase III family protein n=1 Tax=Robertmurraya massiliosenegalensis TaxID=1287657 RepID=UPI0002F79951|nr:ketoacyl-ACP synthase III [Robertmurraya massiliosenegalensis]